jgi:hypothetical protein
MRKKKQAKIPEKLQFYPDEVFKEISLGEDDDRLQLRYAISNYGRLVSFSRWHEFEYGRIVKGSKQDGYRVWNYAVRADDNKLKFRHRFYYRIVAEYFLPKTSDEQVYVLHLDRKRDNDHIENLKWATKAEMLAHSKKSPYVKAALKEQGRLLKKYREQKVDGNKLTVRQVKRLKKKLLDPNRKTLYKVLAKRYGVSEMQLYRIKSGENWGHIKV